MALKLNKKFKSKVEADYWRVGKIDIDRLRNNLLIRMDLYLDKKAKDEGGDPLPSSKEITKVIPLPAEFDNFVSYIYDRVKEPVYEEDDFGNEIQLNEFVDAEDV
jgi:hypothetical protein